MIESKEIVAAVAQLLEQDDIADLAIEDLRKWKRWEMCDKVLGLYGRKGFDVPIIERSILRFALACPAADCPKAAEFVATMRKRDAEKVKDVEELLQLELEAKPAVAAPTKGSVKPLAK